MLVNTFEPKRDVNGNIIKDEFRRHKANANKDAKEEVEVVKAQNKSSKQC